MPKWTTYGWVAVDVFGILFNLAILFYGAPAEPSTILSIVAIICFSLALIGSSYRLIEELGSK